MVQEIAEVPCQARDEGRNEGMNIEIHERNEYGDTTDK